MTEEKGFLPIIIAVVVALIVGGGVTYAVIENSVPEEVKIIPVEEFITEELATTSEEVATTTEESEVEKTVSKPQPAYVAPAPVYVPPKSIFVPDVCLNIEGVQASVPNGFSSVTGICTIESVKDWCPNFEGIQPKIPDGYTFYPRTGTCLTEEEVTKIEDSTRNGLTIEEQQCQDAKEELVDIARQKEVALAEYNANVTEISKNTEGTGGGALQQELDKEQDRYLAQVQILNSRMNTLTYERILYCE